MMKLLARQRADCRFVGALRWAHVDRSQVGRLCGGLLSLALLIAAGAVQAIESQAQSASPPWSEVWLAPIQLYGRQQLDVPEPIAVGDHDLASFSDRSAAPIVAVSVLREEVVPDGPKQGAAYAVDAAFYVGRQVAQDFKEHAGIFLFCFLWSFAYGQLLEAVRQRRRRRTNAARAAAAANRTNIWDLAIKCRREAQAARAKRAP